MARNPRESASESESSRHASSSVTTTKSSQKVKNQAALQKQQQYLSKHINSNGPQDQPKVEPLDFEKFEDDVLIKYNKRYGMNLPNPTSVNNDILNSEIGKKTYTKRNESKQSPNKITKVELANKTKNHFLALPTKENEIITNFLYKVKHQEDEFKLTFR